MTKIKGSPRIKGLPFLLIQKIFGQAFFKKLTGGEGTASP